jgi:preprotein translocase subunit SecF
VLEIVPSGTHIDFIGRRRIAFWLSAFLLLAGLAAAVVQGVRFGIDFAGGTEVAVRFDAGVSADEAALRDLATACGVLDPTVVRYGETDVPEFLIRFNRVEEGAERGAAACPVSEEGRARLAKVDEATGATEETPGAGAVVDFLMLAMGERLGGLELLSVEYVGPRVGDELRRDGVNAMAIAVAFILAYIAFRFSSRFAPGAIVAIVHDVLITSGIFVIFGLEFDLSVLAALLAILGYSLNDTIIIYDRIRENMELRTKHDLEDVLNRSVNQTLSRTLLTSLTTLGAVFCLLLLGGEVIFPFALAMAIGIAVGTYSSVFVAAPTLLFLERRFGGGGGDAGAKAGSRSGGAKAGSPSGKKKRRKSRAA